MHFGEGCKDANEHLVKYGAESLRICIEQAEEVPLEASSPPKTAATTCAPSTRTPAAGCRHRLGQLRRTLHLRAPPPAGDDRTPRDGKSEFTDELVLRLCLRHEWKIAFFSPENMPIAYHLHKLAEKLTGHRLHPPGPA